MALEVGEGRGAGRMLKSELSARGDGRWLRLRAGAALSASRSKFRYRHQGWGEANEGVLLGRSSSRSAVIFDRLRQGAPWPVAPHGRRRPQLRAESVIHIAAARRAIRRSADRRPARCERASQASALGSRIQGACIISPALHTPFRRRLPLPESARLACTGCLAPCLVEQPSPCPIHLARQLRISLTRANPISAASSAPC